MMAFGPGLLRSENTCSIPSNEVSYRPSIHVEAEKELTQ